MTDAATLAGLRKFLLALLVMGLVGTLAELLLTRHWEDSWQMVPLALLSAGLVLLPAAVRSGTPSSFRALRVLFVLFVVAGGLGIFQHYSAKREFALERAPDLRGWALLKLTLKGTTPPLLAPGAMAALGLLGMGWMYGRRAGGQAGSEDTSTGASG